MALVPRRYEPFRIFDELQRELEQTFESLRRSLLPRERESETVGFVPAVDIKEEEDRYLIQVDLPGVDPQDVEVTLENNVLTIRGERKTEAEEKREGYYRVERVYGSFFRSFTLPAEVDEEKIEASYKDGVLTISVPKRPEAVKKAKKIEIKAA